MEEGRKSGVRFVDTTFMQNKKVFSGIGELTILFATLEHRLQQILETLIGDGNTTIGPLFIHGLNLVSLVSKIRMVAPCKLGKEKKLLEYLENALERIDVVRGERNLLIHGDWQIKDANSFPIKVRDFKMHCESGNMQEFTETTITEKKVTALIRRLKGLVNEVDYLDREIRKPQMVSIEHVEGFIQDIDIASA
jgi:hypothetical protein